MAKLKQIVDTLGRFFTIHDLWFLKESLYGQVGFNILNNYVFMHVSQDVIVGFTSLKNWWEVETIILLLSYLFLFLHVMFNIIIINAAISNYEVNQICYF